MTDGRCGLSRVRESCAGQQSTGVSGCLMGEVPPLKGLSDLLLVRNQCHVIVLLAAMDGPPRPERGESSRLLGSTHAHVHTTCTRTMSLETYFTSKWENVHSCLSVIFLAYSEREKCSKEWQKQKKFNCERQCVCSSRQSSPVQLSQRSGTLCRVCMCLCWILQSSTSLHTQYRQRAHLTCISFQKEQELNCTWMKCNSSFVGDEFRIFLHVLMCSKAC